MTKAVTMAMKDSPINNSYLEDIVKYILVNVTEFGNLF